MLVSFVLFKHIIYSNIEGGVIVTCISPQIGLSISGGLVHKCCELRSEVRHEVQKFIMNSKNGLQN